MVRHSLSKKLPIYLFMAFLSVFAFSSCQQANNKSAEKTSAENQANLTVTGEVLDLSCYMTGGAKGAGHKQCAESCLAKGLPAGILSQADGQVYLLVEDHKKAEAYKTAIKHAAETVKITGKVISKNGVQSLVVESVSLDS